MRTNKLILGGVIEQPSMLRMPPFSVLRAQAKLLWLKWRIAKSLPLLCNRKKRIMPFIALHGTKVIDYSIAGRHVIVVNKRGDDL